MCSFELCAPPFANVLSLRRLARAAIAASDDIAGQARTHAATALAAALHLLESAQEVRVARDERDGGDERVVGARRRRDDDRVALLQVGACDRRQAVEHLLKAAAAATLPVWAALPYAFTPRAFSFAARAFALAPSRALASSAGSIRLARVAARSALLAPGSRSLGPLRHGLDELWRDASQCRAWAEGDRDVLARLVVLDRQLAARRVHGSYLSEQARERARDDFVRTEARAVRAALACHAQLVADLEVCERTRLRVARARRVGRVAKEAHTAGRINLDGLDAFAPARLHDDLLLRGVERSDAPAEASRRVERLIARARRAPHQYELPSGLLLRAGSRDAGREHAVADAHVRERDVRGLLKRRLAGRQMKESRLVVGRERDRLARVRAHSDAARRGVNCRHLADDARARGARRVA